MHVLILLLCILLIVLISIDIFQGAPCVSTNLFMRIQFWICMAFLGDFVLEFFLSDDKIHYLKSHLMFLIVSIPYLNIIDYFGFHFSAETEYFLRFIPLIRGGYALAIIVSWLTYSSASSLFVSYLTILLSSIYFASLLFFNVEIKANPLITCYGDALWWACMDVTTVGSNITAVTSIGKVLSVALAAMGMMMLPIFTVYITSHITSAEQKRKREFLKLFSKGEIPDEASTREVNDIEKDDADSATSSDSVSSTASASSSAPASSPTTAAPASSTSTDKPASTK
jgi:hypothetical protein